MKQEVSPIVLIQRKIASCTKCRLHINSNKVQMLDGNEQSNLLIVAEAPGGMEERTGEPMRGQTGKYLMKILNSYGVFREDIWIENVLHCRPPNNRKPKEDEIGLCLNYLFDIIMVMKPPFILTMGVVATNALLGRPYDAPLKEIRGRWKKQTLLHYDEEHIKHNCQIMPTWHPSYAKMNKGGEIGENFKDDVLTACIKLS